MERARKKVFVVSAKRRNKEAAQFHLMIKGMSIFYPDLFFSVSAIFGRYIRLVSILQIGSRLWSRERNECVCRIPTDCLLLFYKNFSRVCATPAALEPRPDK